jgi:hypothetical protein
MTTMVAEMQRWLFDRARTLLLLLPLTMFVPAAAAGVTPQFEEYAVSEQSGASPVPVVLRGNPEARRFRTVLRKGATKGPNFAGHFTIVSWGCGTNCQSIAIVDSKTGVVRFAPFGSEIGQEFRLDSRLLVVNPACVVAEYLADYGGCPPSPLNMWLTSRYFEWTGEQFRHITDIPACPEPENQNSGDRMKKAQDAGSNHEGSPNKGHPLDAHKDARK